MFEVMSFSRRKNVWDNVDKKKLLLMFNTGLPLRRIARILKRSPSAVNKALTRFGVRPFGTRKLFSKNYIYLNDKQLQQILEESTQEQVINANLSDSQTGIEKALELAQIAKMKRSLFCRYKKQRANHAKFSKLKWLTFDYIIDYLRDNGYVVDKFEKYQSGIPPNFSYLINNKPISKAQLLVEANKIRLLKKQDPFLVDGVTGE
jgi:transposase